MRLDQTTLREVVDFSDDLGVISLYASHLPTQAAQPQPAAPIELRNQIREGVNRIDRHDQRLAEAIRRCLDTAADEVEWLTSALNGGRGRALFLGVASGAKYQVTSQLPFRERAVHHDSPYVRPLLAALDEGRAAGALDVSVNRIKLRRWEAGEITDVLQREFEVLDEQVSRQKLGPAPANAHRFSRGHSNREQYTQHLNDLDQQFLADAIAEVIALAHTEGWDRLVVSGSPKLRPAAAETIREQNGIRVIVADRIMAEESAATISTQIWPLLRSVREEREQDLAATAVDRTLSGGSGALGLRACCQALNEGRVQHLIYDDSLRLTGYRSTAGTVHPHIEGVIATSDVKFLAEPLLLERMVESALSSGAAITPLGPVASAKLADHEGIAALLRW